MRCQDQLAPSPSCENQPGVLGPGQPWYSTQSESYLRVELGVDPADSLFKFVAWKPNVKHCYTRAGNFGTSARYVLSKVVDPSGNTVVYEWTFASASTNFPSRIYNGTTIAFHHTQRTLAEAFSEVGRLERMDRRLAVIDVCVESGR